MAVVLVPLRRETALASDTEGATEAASEGDDDGVGVMVTRKRDCSKPAAVPSFSTGGGNPNLLARGR